MFATYRQPWIHIWEHSYMRSLWNVFDFVVVVCSILIYTPGGQKLRVFKVMRVLRPLKALGRLTGLRVLVGAITKSFQSIGNISVLFLFFMYLYSTIGSNSYSGLFHYRCRVTPFPVKLDPSCLSAYNPCWENYIANVSASPDLWRCLDEPNDDTTWNKDDSPWHTPRDCIWPTRREKRNRVCSTSLNGLNQCYPGLTWCGSNYDIVGNPRFIDSPIPYGVTRMTADTFFPELNYGFTNFDNFAQGFLSLFQVLTRSDWSLIMYMGADSVGVTWSAFYFCSFVLLGAYVFLNFILA